MSKDSNKASKEPGLLAGDPGYVGRGHPPKHGQIKRGETKNPWEGAASLAPTLRKVTSLQKCRGFFPSLFVQRTGRAIAMCKCS